jgi:hypothetical protein
MIEPHPKFRLPDKPAKYLWRYMNFTRFKILIMNKKLFIPNATLFEDPFDCSLPRRLLTQISNEAGIIASQRLMRDPWYRPSMSDPRDNWMKKRAGGRVVQKEERDARASAISEMNASRRRLFISCWHSSDNQSAALWKFYSSQEESKRETEFAVAVRVDLEAFQHWLQAEPHSFSFGQIDYVDFEDQSLEIDRKDPLSFAIYKRMSFDYEKEIRAIHLWPSDSGEPPRGLFLPFPIPFLKTHIFVDPKADGNALSAVRGVVDGIYSDPKQRVPVDRSNLYDGHLY